MQMIALKVLKVHDVSCKGVYKARIWWIGQEVKTVDFHSTIGGSIPPSIIKSILSHFNPMPYNFPYKTQNMAIWGK